MKTLFTICLLNITLQAANAVAGTSGRLRLSGVVYSHSSTSVTETKTSFNQLHWTVIHSHNSFNIETQKIEIEGEERPGLTKKIDLSANKGKFIQQKILLDLVTYNHSEKKPIILKISAN